MNTQAPETVEGESATKAASTGRQKRDAKGRERAERIQERHEAKATEKARFADDTYHLRVSRYDPKMPEKQEPRFDDFHVLCKQGTMILNTLMWARDHYDSLLTSQHSYRQAVCGSDALSVNGSQQPGRKAQLSDLSEPIRVGLLPHPGVIKDLVVDMGHFYDQMGSVEPYFRANLLPDSELDEQHQTREGRKEAKMSTRCVQCSVCMSSRNIAADDSEYPGPATINKAHRFTMDEREGEDVKQRRLETLEQGHGVWRCQAQFSCAEVRPKDIPLMEHIQELKCEAIKNNLKL